MKRQLFTFTFLLFFHNILSASVKEIEAFKVHTFGDSHCITSFIDHGKENRRFDYLYEVGEENLIIPFHIHPIGARLLYSFGKRGCEHKFFDGIKKGEYVVFSMGTIDANRHLVKFIDDIEDLRLRIIAMVDVYLERIQTYNEGIDFIPIIFGVLPAWDGVDMPFFLDGSVPLETEKRVFISRMLNTILKERCFHQGILYFDVYEEASDERGVLRKDLSGDGQHLSSWSNGFVSKKLCDLIWNDYAQEDKLPAQ